MTSSLLTQIREDASRIETEADPVIKAAIEQLGIPSTITSVVVALIGRLEESIPGLIRPDNSPLPAPLTNHTATDEEIAQSNAIPANQPVAAQPVATQVPAAAPPVQTQAPQQRTMEELEAELKTEQAKVAALQQAITPQSAPAPVVQPTISPETQSLAQTTNVSQQRVI